MRVAAFTEGRICGRRKYGSSATPFRNPILATRHLPFGLAGVANQHSIPCQRALPRRQPQRASSSTPCQIVHARRKASRKSQLNLHSNPRTRKAQRTWSKILPGLCKSWILVWLFLIRCCNVSLHGLISCGTPSFRSLSMNSSVALTILRRSSLAAGAETDNNQARGISETLKQMMQQSAGLNDQRPPRSQDALLSEPMFAG